MIKAIGTGARYPGRYVVVNEDGKVVSWIEWNVKFLKEAKKWKPPKNHIAVQSNEAQIGDIYDFEKKTFSTP